MKILQYIILALIFFFSYYSELEGINPDSLKIEYAKIDETNVKKRLELLKAIASDYLHVDLDSSQLYSEISIKLAKQEGDKLQLANGYQNLAIGFNLRGIYQDALESIQTSIDVYKSIGDDQGESAAISIKGSILENLHQYDEANKHYNESLKIAEQIGDSVMIGVNYQNMGIVYDRMGKYDKAIETYVKAIKVFYSLNEEFRLSQVYSNMGIVYYFMKQKEKCLEYYEMSIKIKRKIGSDQALALGYSNLSEIHNNFEDLNQAQMALDSALLYAQKTKSENLLTSILFSQGNLHLKKEEFESAMRCYEKGVQTAMINKDDYLRAIGTTNIGEIYTQLGEYKMASGYFDDALNYAKSIESVEMEKDILLAYAPTLKKDKKYKKAAAYYERLIVLKDSLFSNQKLKAVNEIETKYQSEKKEAENKILQQEKALQAATIESQRAKFYGSLIGALLFACIAFLFFRQSKNRKNTNMILSDKNKKIELLHSELSHRFKNNLMFVSSLLSMQSRRLVNEEAKQAVKESESRIDAMSLLHRRLELDTDATISFGAYMNDLCTNIKNTYALTNNSPAFIIVTDELAIEGDMAVRLGLIVNELVTNSVKYAFVDELNPKIEIYFKEIDSENYRLTYQDNGIGLPPKFDIKKSNSLGLKLIHSLTKQLKGEFYFENREGAYFQFDFNESNSLA